MSRSMNRVWLLLLCFLAGEALALGLGDIRLDSALNQPLRADIILISATPEELDNLSIELASAETFARYGIDRPFFLSRLSFQVIRSGRTDGNVVRVTSPDPITEPFLTFLVEATWTRGRLLREYTLLLDPPTFAPPPSAAQQQVVEPPVRSTPADSGDIPRRPAPAATAPQAQPQPAVSRPAPRPAPAPAAQPSAAATPMQPEPAAAFDTTSGGDYSVRQGDTLWGIASRMRPDDRLTMNQTMLAIYEANPEAFSNNINVLSAGASLRIPSADEVFRINRGDALAEVQRQNSAWGGPGAMPQPADPQPSLTLVPPDEDTLSPDSSTVYDGADPDEASDAADTSLSIEDVRIQEIEELLADEQDGLVVINDNELTALRRELAELRGEEFTEDLLGDLVDEDLVDDELVDDELMVDDEDAVFTDDLEEPDLAGTDTSEPEVTEPVTPVSQPPAAEPGLVERIMGLMSNIWVPIGAALAIVAALLVWFARRASGGGDEDEATGLWETLDSSDMGGDEAAQSTERLRAMARDDDASIVVVEQSGDPSLTSTMEVPPMEATMPTEDVDILSTTDTNRALEDTFSSETAINLDQSDPIAEADFHMAYGLYDQAADLINGALAVDSGRQDLMAKLCEIYFVWGNRDAFVDAAQRLQASLSGAEDPEWDKIVIMGQQIAGDHALFSDASAAGATKAVDLSFDSDSDATGALDMDLDSGDAAGDDMIDLGAETQSTPARSDESAIDFVFDDDEDAGTAVTEQMPAADPFAGAFEATGEMPTVDASLDDTAESPTIETPAADSTLESPTIEQQLGTLEATTTGEIPAFADNEATEIAGLDDTRAADATAEIDLDDLGLDLDAMQGSLNDDFTDQGDGVLSDLDDTSESMSLNMDDLEATGRNQLLTDPDATGTNEVLSVADTGLHDSLDIDEALAATSEVPGLTDTASSRALPDEPMEDESDLGIDATLLDATGQTQILPDDFAVETGTGRNIERALADDEATMLAKSPLDSELADDAETMLASLDDDEPTSAGDFDFAKTEALPKDVFTGDLADDATGEMPALAPGSTDMDLDLDDLTAALQISAAGDTVNQVRDDATVEQPRPNAGNIADFDGEPTAAISPDEMSDDLHDARTMTEVGTKLDLARAYVDMGDPAGARSILEEVLDEGDDSQQQQARQLLDSLPT